MKVEAKVPPGYAVEKLKHEDGGYLVLGPRKVVVGLAKTLGEAVQLAKKDAKTRSAS